METNIKLKGLRGWNCFTAYLSVLYFLPNSKTIRDQKFENRNECVEFFKAQEPETRKAILFELIALGCVSSDNINALISVHTDAHGIAIDQSNIGNFGVVQLSQMALESLMACSEVFTDFF